MICHSAATQVKIQSKIPTTRRYQPIMSRHS